MLSDVVVVANKNTQLHNRQTKTKLEASTQATISRQKESNYRYPDVVISNRRTAGGAVSLSLRQQRDVGKSEKSGETQTISQRMVKRLKEKNCWWVPHVKIFSHGCYSEIFGNKQSTVKRYDV